jgi:hypothetical protein
MTIAIERGLRQTKTLARICLLLEQVPEFVSTLADALVLDMVGFFEGKTDLLARHGAHGATVGNIQRLRIRCR